MAVTAALLCVAAIIWIIIRTQKPSVKQRFRKTQEAFEDAPSGNLFENAPIGYMEVDRQGIVRRVNHLESKLRGLEANVMLGVHCAELISEIDRARYREQLQRKMAGHTALVVYQREYAHENGRKISVEVHEDLIRNPGGTIAGLRMASIDVTERKNSEQVAYQNAAEL